MPRSQARNCYSAFRRSAPLVLRGATPPSPLLGEREKRRRRGPRRNDRAGGALACSVSCPRRRASSNRRRWLLDRPVKPDDDGKAGLFDKKIVLSFRGARSASRRMGHLVRDALRSLSSGGALRRPVGNAPHHEEKGECRRPCMRKTKMTGRAYNERGRQLRRPLVSKFSHCRRRRRTIGHIRCRAAVESDNGNNGGHRQPDVALIQRAFVHALRALGPGDSFAVSNSVTWGNPTCWEVVQGTMCPYRGPAASHSKTGHCHFQTRPPGVKTGQHPASKKNILRTENK
jgi:hypothetical protein